MKILKKIYLLIKKDPSYLLALGLTFALFVLILSMHRWSFTVVASKLPALTSSTSDVTSYSHSDLPDFSSITSVKQKKQRFFDFLRPLIHHENQKIQAERVLLDSIKHGLMQSAQEKNQALEKLTSLARDYRLLKVDEEINDPERLLQALQLRVDLIPESLVLAQAANESAWGTSRFAVEANNLFGQWCYRKGCGLVPSGRSENARHEVRRFANPQQSVASYMKNLNSHYAYQQLRAIRAELRHQGKNISGTILANGLEKYSQRGKLYVEELISMMHQNKLE